MSATARFILDSLALYDVLRFDLPPPEASQPNYIERRLMALRRWLTRGDLPTYRELGQANGKAYEEVAIALTGLKSSMVRINERAEVIVSVAVPVTRFRAVRGALMLSTQGAEIDDMVTAERLAVLRVFLFAAARHGGAVVPARRHDRRPDAPPCGIRRGRAPAHQDARRDPRLHPSRATRSGICPARCAT